MLFYNQQNLPAFEQKLFRVAWQGISIKQYSIEKTLFESDQRETFRFKFSSLVPLNKPTVTH